MSTNDSPDFDDINFTYYLSHAAKIIMWLKNNLTIMYSMLTVIILFTTFTCLQNSCRWRKNGLRPELQQKVAINICPAWVLTSVQHGFSSTMEGIIHYIGTSWDIKCLKEKKCQRTLVRQYLRQTYVVTQLIEHFFLLI